MRRVISLWLPHWQTDLQCPPGLWRGRPYRNRSAAPDEPLALTEAAAGTERLAAVSAATAALGLAPGMTVADARALVPELITRPAEPKQAAAALGKLADWALRFTPWASTCGTDGLWLDVSGCAHLFGGEEALLARFKAGLDRRGFHARLAMADTPGAAWAVARFGAGGVVPADGARDALIDLPVAALRLDTVAVAGLERVGLRRIGDIVRQPRAPLATRYGAEVLRRLDQAFGRASEPIAPRRPPAAYQARRVFAEPVADTASIEATLRALLDDLGTDLVKAGRGVRRLALMLFRIDGDVRAVEVGTSRPTRDAAALARLFADKLDGLEVGEGIEVMQLAASATDPLPDHQTALVDEGADGAALGDLVDRLANRLGSDRVARLGPRESHQPDSAVMRLPPIAPAEPDRATDWPQTPLRPVRLLTPPVPVEAVAMVPDGPPRLFRWRGQAHRVARASGPERIEDEWWREDRPTRDYYRVEDESGARFWLYREGLYRDPALGADGGPRWYLHGLFA